MNVKGIHKTSLIDYPGKICSIIFSGGCNMRCLYCHNPELACNSSGISGISNEEVLDLVKARRRRGLIDGVSLSGGEPTLAKNIEPFIRELRGAGLAIKLDTNGLNPSLVEKLLSDNLLDYVAMDVKTSPEKYGDLTGVRNAFPLVRRTIQIVQESATEYEIRTTCVPHYVTMEDFIGIRGEIGHVSRYYLQQFVNLVTLDESMGKVVPYSVTKLRVFRDYVKTFSDVCEISGA